MNNNRIGNACWYRTYDCSARVWSEWRKGKLRAWSTDHVEGETGFGLFPVGVIEDCETLFCKSVHVTDICFAKDAPTE